MSDVIGICQGVDNIKEVLNVALSHHLCMNDDLDEIRIKCANDMTLHIFPEEFFYDMYDQEVKRRYCVKEYDNIYDYSLSSTFYDSIKEIAEHIDSLGGFKYNKSRIDSIMESVN